MPSLRCPLHLVKLNPTCPLPPPSPSPAPSPQIHNWARDVATGANIEFVAPAKAYVVNRGEVTVIDLAQVPALTPRQLNSLSGFDAGLEAGFST